MIGDVIDRFFNLQKVIDFIFMLEGYKREVNMKITFKLLFL